MRVRIGSLMSVIIIACALAAPQIALAAAKPPAAPTVLTGAITSAQRPHGTVAGATVTLYKNSRKGWLPVTSTTSAADGTYKFSGVAAGAYRLGFSAPHFVSEYYHDAASVAAAGDVVVGTGTTTVNESLAPGARTMAQLASTNVGTTYTRKIAVSTTLNKFYVSAPGEIVVVDGATKAVVSRVPLASSDVFDVAVDEANLKAYVATYDGVFEVDLLGETVRAFPGLSVDRISVSPKSGKVFVKSTSSTDTKTVYSLDLSSGVYARHALTDIPDSNSSNYVYDLYVDPVKDVLYVSCGYSAEWIGQYQASDMTPLGMAMGFWGICWDIDVDSGIDRLYIPLGNSSYRNVYSVPGPTLYASASNFFLPHIAVDDVTGIVYAAETDWNAVADVNLVAFDAGTSASGSLAPFASQAVPGANGNIMDLEVNEATGEVAAIDPNGGVYFFQLQWAQ